MCISGALLRIPDEDTASAIGHPQLIDLTIFIGIMSTLVTAFSCFIPQ